MLRRKGIPFDKVLEDTGLLLLGVDPEGRVVHFNTACEKASGYSREEVIGRYFWDFEVPRDQLKTPLSLFERLGQGEDVGPLEHHIFTKDGGRRLISWRMTTTAMGKGGPTIALGVGMDITERRLAEEALANREGFFRMLIENALDLVTVLGADARIIYMGPSVERLLGYEQEEMIGRYILEYVHPGDAEAAKAALDFAMGRPGVTGYAEVRIRHKDGSWRCLEASSFNLLSDPQVEGMVINSRDITDHKAIEEELRRRSRELENILQALPDLYFRLSPDGTIIDYRTGRTTYLYVSPEEFMGKKVRDVLPEEIGVEVERSIEEARLTGAFVSFEYRLMSPDGAREYEARFMPAFEDEVIAVIRDITERADLLSSLRESEENYRVTFESTGTAMVVLGLDGTIVDANREIEKLLGYDRNEVMGRRNYMEFVYPEDREAVRRYSLRLLKGEIAGPARYEARTVHRDGRVINTIINVSVLPGMGKSVASLVDITDKKSYEIELEARAAQLRDFLDIAAHELRHPATIIKGYAAAMANYGKDMAQEDLESSLEAITRGVDKLTGVVEDLLDVSRIERGFMSLERSEQALLPLVRSAVDEMAERGSVETIEIVRSGEPGVVRLDPEKFTRLMIILLENALKYSPAGSPIEVSLDVGNGRARISVLDRGVGVNEKERNRIFDRFYQSEEVFHHSSPGLGLGLYIAKRIVEAHGGKIWCEPREGGGSVFRFTLPLR
jgi:PAS domain S-box-containing protein